MKGAGQELKRNLALAVGALLLAFAVPEALLRIMRPAFTQEIFNVDESLPGMRQMVSDTKRYVHEHGIHQPPNIIRAGDLLWSLVPGYQAEIPRLPPIEGEKRTWRLEVNDLGLRGRRPSDGSGVFHVLCLGDSITFGDKLDQGSTYPEILEQFLQKRWPGRKLEVINAGVPGYSSHQGIALWRELRSLRPDVVVLAFGINDTWPTRVPDREHLPLDGSLVGLIRANLQKTELYRALRAVLLATRRRLMTSSQEGTVQLTQRRVPVDETTKNMRTMTREVRAEGARVIVVHTAFGHADIARALKRVAREEEVPFVDGEALFSAERARRQKALADKLNLKGTCSNPGTVSSGYVLRVRMPQGRTTAEQILSSVRGIAIKPIVAPLADDGLGCDERRGDGVHTGLLQAPPGQLLHVVFQERRPDGTTEGEFRDFPLAWREIHAGKSASGGPLVGPVEVYGRPELMSDSIHPNAEGAALLAKSVAGAIR